MLGRFQGWRLSEKVDGEARSGSGPDGEDSRRDRRGRKDRRGVLGGGDAITSERFYATALVCPKRISPKSPPHKSKDHGHGPYPLPPKPGRKRHHASARGSSDGNGGGQVRKAATFSDGLQLFGWAHAMSLRPAQPEEGAVAIGRQDDLPGIALLGWRIGNRGPFRTGKGLS
jgi:hypothetical protein